MYMYMYMYMFLYMYMSMFSLLFVYVCKSIPELYFIFLHRQRCFPTCCKDLVCIMFLELMIFRIRHRAFDSFRSCLSRLQEIVKAIWLQ